jgi:hypothetical protein
VASGDRQINRGSWNLWFVNHVTVVIPVKMSHAHCYGSVLVPLPASTVTSNSLLYGKYSLNLNLKVMKIDFIFMKIDFLSS